MQKFVVIKSANKQMQNTASQPDVPKIRMSGYLKKKRKKMGGWRKLWFVLQNRLLLSYSSKEDYEKKLAPFKDVVSLVPGTVITPGKGFRFIIETTTNIIYTYRCDDHKTCSEWMAALVDSLSNDRDRPTPFQTTNQSYYNRSLDNLPQSQSKRSIKSSRSWDSICRSRSNKPSANLPIACNTARILERNGLQNHDKCEEIIKTKPNKCERVQNFRLHQQNDQKVIQSAEVNRINSMFKKSDSTTTIQCSVKQYQFTNNNNNNSSNNQNSSSNNTDQTNMDQVTTVVNSNSTSNKMKENFVNCPLEEKIRKLSLIDLSNATINDTEKFTNRYTSNIDLVEESITPSPTTSSSIEPIYAVVDLKTKYARRAKMKDFHEKLEKDRPKSCNIISSDYEEVMQIPSFIELNEDENENIYEPVCIPELPSKSPMWRYFPKINLEALIELTKKRNNKDEPSTFYDIRKRWGNHRKSIKNRMKKLVNSGRVSAANSISDEDLNSQGASCSTSGCSSSKSSANSSIMDKDNKFILNFATETNDKNRKIEKHIFGSLGRLRKSRTSLCLDDLQASKKKLPIANDTNFQKELKKELIKRNGSINDKKTSQCHSKFYD